MLKENCGLQIKFTGAKFQQIRIAKETVNTVRSFEDANSWQLQHFS